MTVEFLGRATEQKNAYRSLQGMQKRPIIFLGLGGVGSASVSKVKDLLGRTFADYVEEGQPSPIPDGIQFLCFDSAKSEKPKNLFKEQEWVRLVAENIDDVIPELLKDPFYAPWLPAISGHDYSTGCSGFRALGRLLFTQNIHRFHRKFSGKMRKASSYPRLDDMTPLVCIFASLAGGTGSGCLLDACFYIRQNYPAARIYGFLGVVDGVQELDQRMHVNATVGAYAALKEIDAFMADTRTEQYGYETGASFEYPAARAIYSKVDRPFDDCFLIGTENAKGVSNLTDPGRLSSFMARVAFMLTAYSTDSSKGTRSFEAEMNDRKGHLEGPIMGALARYCVPALGQVHIPTEETADCLACKASSKFLSFLAGGAPHPDAQSRKLLDDLGVSLDTLADRVAHREDGNPIRPANWSEKLETELNDKTFRYSKAGRSQIVGYGEAMAGARAGRYAGEMQVRADAEVTRINDAIFDAVSGALKEEPYLTVGGIDLLDDLLGALREEISRYTALKAEELDPRARDIEQTWVNLKSLVDDVCTKSSMIDLDFLRVGKTKNLYTSFLSSADMRCLRQAKYDQARAVLGAVVSYVKKLKKDLEQFQTICKQAKGLFDEEVARLVTLLRGESQGMGASVDDICSFSLLGPEWRSDYLDNEQLVGPQPILHGLCRGDYGPRAWLEITRKTRPAEHLAQDLFERIDRLFFSKVRRMKIGEVFDVAGGAGRAASAETLARMISEYTSPQINVHGMSKYLNSPSTPLGFVGGIDDDLCQKLVQENEYEEITRAKSYEEGKISYLEIHHPIALAGCEVLRTRFFPAYEQWRKDLKRQPSKENQKLLLKRFHCFKESADWQEPIYYSPRATAESEKLAQCFAISVILDPVRLGPEHPGHAMLQKAVDEIEKVAKHPREKRLGLFKIGKSDFWLTPFFDVASPRDVKPPVRLGGTLPRARKALKSLTGSLDQAMQWIEWFDNNWALFFNAQERAAGIRAALDEAKRLRKQQQMGTEAYSMWDEVVGALEGWE